MLIWDLNIPDECGMTRERYEQLLEQGTEPEDFEPPDLLPENDRAYRCLIRLLPISDRSTDGRLELNYQALRDIMEDRGCNRIDRERILDAWIAIRSRDAAREGKTESDDWEKRKREWFNEGVSAEPRAK